MRQRSIAFITFNWSRLICPLLAAGEVVRLRAGDIDSEQMIIRVVQSKGLKDRHVMLPVYDLLMKASAETTLAIAADPKRLSARIGVTAVLHTWGSALTHHPHVHMIVPGGGLSLDGARWVTSRSPAPPLASRSHLAALLPRRPLSTMPLRIGSQPSHHLPNP